MNKVAYLVLRVVILNSSCVLVLQFDVLVCLSLLKQRTVDLFPLLMRFGVCILFLRLMCNSIVFWLGRNPGESTARYWRDNGQVGFGIC